GVFLIFAAYPVLTGRPLRRLWPAFAVALLPLVLWNVATWLDTGTPHLAYLFRPGMADLPRNVGVHAVVMVLLAGGAAIVPPFFAAASLREPGSRRALFAATAVVLVTLAVLQAFGRMRGWAQVVVYPLFL